MRHFLSKFVLLSCLVYNSYSANILYLAHIASPSHGIWNTAFIDGLVKSGHNVTEIAVFNNNKTNENYNKIYLEQGYNSVYNEKSPGIEAMVNMPVSFQFKVLYEWFCVLNCEGKCRL